MPRHADKIAEKLASRAMEWVAGTFDGITGTRDYAVSALTHRGDAMLTEVTPC
jgi:hypothetical protein